MRWDTLKDTECRLTIGDVCCSLRFKDTSYSSYLMRGTLRENVKMHDTRCKLNLYPVSGINLLVLLLIATYKRHIQNIIILHISPIISRSSHRMKAPRRGAL
jgi:hypothetical protein